MMANDSDLADEFGLDTDAVTVDLPELQSLINSETTSSGKMSKLSTIFRFSRSLNNSQMAILARIKGHFYEIILAQQISVVAVEDDFVVLTKHCDPDQRTAHRIKCYDAATAQMLGERMVRVFHKPASPYSACFPPHDAARCRIFMCAAAYFEAVADAMMAARHTIMIADWFFSCELYLKRAKGHPLAAEWRLDNLLQRKAREGVQIYVMIYKDIAVQCGSKIAKTRLETLHDNVHVVLHRPPPIPKLIIWTHHQKFVVIDNALSFIGGIDLAFGRFDTPSHPLLDPPRNGSVVMPGMDYTNPQLAGCGRSDSAIQRPFRDLFDRSTTPRMPWQDYQVCINGEAARDIGLNFIQRWNEHISDKAKTSVPIWPTFHKHEWMFPGGWGGARTQVLRSMGPWSGHSTWEKSIYFATIQAIQQSKHYVYIESQFFISAPRGVRTQVVNLVAQALGDRIARAIEWEKKHGEVRAPRVLNICKKRRRDLLLLLLLTSLFTTHTPPTLP